MSRCSCLLIRERIFSMGTMPRGRPIFSKRYIYAERRNPIREVKTGKWSVLVRKKLIYGWRSAEARVLMRSICIWKRTGRRALQSTACRSERRQSCLESQTSFFSHRRILVSLKTDRRSGGVLLIWNFVSWISFTYTSFPITIKWSYREISCWKSVLLTVSMKKCWIYGICSW